MRRSLWRSATFCLNCLFRFDLWTVVGKYWFNLFLHLFSWGRRASVVEQCEWLSQSRTKCAFLTSTEHFVPSCCDPTMDWTGKKTSLETWTKWNVCLLNLQRSLLKDKSDLRLHISGGNVTFGAVWNGDGLVRFCHKNDLFQEMIVILGSNIYNIVTLGTSIM